MKNKKLYFIKSQNKFKYNNNLKKRNIALKICFILIIVFYNTIKKDLLNIKILNTIFSFLSYMKLKIELNNTEKLLLSYKSIKVKTIVKHKKLNNPKISVISPVHNSEKYIHKFLINIQKQMFVKIEIL